MITPHMTADEHKARVDGDAAALRVIDELRLALRSRDALLRRWLNWDTQSDDHVQVWVNIVADTRRELSEL